MRPARCKTGKACYRNFLAVRHDLQALKRKQRAEVGTEREDMRPLRIYRCPVCGTMHIGHYTGADVRM